MDELLWAMLTGASEISTVVGGRVFWGLDALPLLRAHLAGGADGAALDAAWSAPDGVAVGVRR